MLTVLEKNNLSYLFEGKQHSHIPETLKCGSSKFNTLLKTIFNIRRQPPLPDLPDSKKNINYTSTL